MGRLFGALRGGLGISVVLVGALLAAAKGVVGATTVTMGLIMLPTMLRYGYDPRLAAGTVAATATLAQIIPPATVLVLLGDQLNNAYQAAQLAKGIFAPESVSVGDLFAGALVPAFALVALYILYLVAVAVVPARRRRRRSRPIPDAPRGFALARQLAEVLVAPVVLIVVVLGSILGGLASPTEAAAGRRVRRHRARGARGRAALAVAGGIAAVLPPDGRRGRSAARPWQRCPSLIGGLVLALVPVWRAFRGAPASSPRP